MIRYGILAGYIVVGVLVWAAPGWAGWVIEQVAKGGGEEGREQVLIQANRMKTLMLDAGGRPATAFILDLEAQTITQVDYQQRHFMIATIQEFVQTMRGAVTGAMSRMEEAMKDMPPEQRQMMEQMLRAQGVRPGPAPQECREPRVELRRTSQQATIAGHPAVRYDVLADGKLESELWIARGITAWRELDPRRLERFGAEMAQAVACGPAERRGGLFKADHSWKLAGEGYPARTVDRSSGATVEVVKAESRTIPAAEFQPPAGFARKSLREMTGQ